MFQRKTSLFFACILFICILFALAVPGSPIHSAPMLADARLPPADKQHFLHDKFVLVRTVAAIPAPVRAVLLGNGPRSGMADSGKPFEIGDAVGPDPLPFRRLIFAGISPGYCLVYNEYGGIAYGTEVSLYRLSARRAVLVWQVGLPNHTGKLTLPQLRQQFR